MENLTNEFCSEHLIRCLIYNFKTKLQDHDLQRMQWILIIIIIENNIFYYFSEPTN